MENTTKQIKHITELIKIFYHIINNKMNIIFTLNNYKNHNIILNKIDLKQQKMFFNVKI